MVKTTSRKPRGAGTKPARQGERGRLGVRGAVCVVGMHRSGTSLVASLLAKCGLHLGPEDALVRGDENNRRGYFEHAGFVGVNDALLEHFHGSWDEPPQLPPSWQFDPGIASIATEARSVLHSLESNGGCFGWKDPRTTILLPFWKMLVENVRFVVCLRNPLEVARSLARRDRMPARRAAALWEAYTLAAVRDTADAPRIFVCYEDVLAQPRDEIRRIAAFCGFEPDEASVSDGLELVDPKLRHGEADVEGLLRSEDFTAALRLFYVGLRGVARDDPASASGAVDALAQVGRRLHDASVLARVDAQLGEREREIDALQRTAREHELASARRDEHVSQLIEHNRSLLDEVRALRTTLQAARDEVVNLTAARNFLAEELARLKGEDSPAAATAAPAAEATTVPRSDEETH
jgi:hypothetical protein